MGNSEYAEVLEKLDCAFKNHFQRVCGAKAARREQLQRKLEHVVGAAGCQ